MNGQFIENGQDRIHQHFFERFTREFIRGKWRTYAVKEPEELGYDYRYVDVTPWNQPYNAPESKFTGTSNPMGFKGLIRFTRARLEVPLDDHAHACAPAEDLQRSGDALLQQPLLIPSTRVGLSR